MTKSFEKTDAKKYSDDKFTWRDSSSNRFEKSWQNYRSIVEDFDSCWLRKDVVDVKLSEWDVWLKFAKDF